MVYYCEMCGLISIPKPALPHKNNAPSRVKCRACGYEMVEQS
jgi:rubredoxin